MGISVVSSPSQYSTTSCVVCGGMHVSLLQTDIMDLNEIMVQIGGLVTERGEIIGKHAHMEGS